MSTNTNRTTIEFEQTEDGSWKATEPAADHDLYGRGETAPLAVAHYAKLIEDSNPTRQGVPADD